METNDYLVLAGDDRHALDELGARLRPRLIAYGWRAQVRHPLLRVYVGPGSRLEITAAPDGHGVVIGDVFDRSASRRLDETSRRRLVARPLDLDRSATMIRDLWGRYVLVRTAGQDLAALRDPSGALECVAWRLGGVGVLASTAAQPIDDLFPPRTCIDEDQLRTICRQPGEFHHRLALTELLPIAAGALAVLSATGATVRQVWRPAEIYRRRPERPDDGRIRDTVVDTVRALVGEGTWIGELSGGLDSAVVAACLDHTQKTQVRGWVNHVTPQIEGDERVYAQAAAERLGISLTEVHRETIGLNADVLGEADGAFRPPINDLDPGYNTDIQHRIREAGVDGVITGQGGDAVFFQMATPMIGVDELAERGARARPAVLHRTARWCRRSAWPQTWLKAWMDARQDRGTWTHPWTEELKGVPPAKAFQINAIAYSQVFQQKARRSAGGDCLNPLLAQPIVELGLSLSTVDLTWGGRDRALMRRAFSADLPARLLERRSKGDVGAFYGLGLRSHLPWLRPYLLEGALAERELITRRDVEALLSEDRLIWQGDYGRILSLTWTEAWLRHWRSRLASRSPVPADNDQTSRWSAHTSA